MPKPKEICVFLPCHTLEDFPTHLRDEVASGLLAAWTSPWHPEILAAVGALPVWHRADTTPVEMDRLLLIIPSASESRLPSDFQQRVGDATDTKQVNVTNRADAVRQILDYLHDVIPSGGNGAGAAMDGGSAVERTSAVDLASSPAGPERAVVADDFFALGFAALQVQLMTRKLRYSSNLDQAIFSEHVISAARAWTAGRREEARDSLQAAYDLLAEERDHYFSADPHLVDLVLVAESTVGDPLMRTLRGDQPLSLLMSARVAELIREQSPEIAERIAERHRAGTLSVIGGGADDVQRLEVLSGAAVARWLHEGVERVERALGLRPKVFGRLGGGIPGDLPPWLIAEKYIGAITSDFTAGVGSQSEAKLLWQAGGSEIEALTARPLDADQPQSFLGIGPRMGEAADSGEVATALMVRWPGGGAGELDDLRRAASWGMALGRFWTLDHYFTNGERPYHSCTLPSAPADGAWLSQAVSEDVADPLSSVAREFTSGLRDEATAALAALATIVGGDSASSPKPASEDALAAEARRLSAAIGMRAGDVAATSAASAAIALNPHSGPARTEFEIAGPPPAASTPGLFGATRRKRGSQLTVDIPGHGFTTVASNPSGGRSRSLGLRGLFRKPRPMAYGQALSNEFLDVAIHPESGGVAAVHAGAQRGNRFSWQLARFDANGPGDGYSAMKCRQLRVVSADTAEGIIEARGVLAVEQRTVAEFEIQYTLKRGSRWLIIDVALDGCEAVASDPWRSYIAGRAAWATDALSIRPLVRDKRHRTSGRRIEAPLGIVVDEGDRHLQVCGFGLPAHRRTGSQRLDTLLRVAGESANRFRLAYGFDVPSPVRAARQLIVPAAVVPLAEPPAQPSRGWLVDVEPRSVLLTDWKAEGAHTFCVRALETSGKPVRMRLRACRQIVSVERTSNGASLPTEDDALALRMAGHEVVGLRVQLAP